MLFKCHSCNRVGFQPTCGFCGEAARDDNVSLNPEYYPEFQYRSRGIVKDILFKKKAEEELQEKLDAVLDKYREFEHPYFVNFVHYAGRRRDVQPQSGEYPRLTLFHSVLLGLGFGELAEFPSLTEKLVLSTLFRFEYQSFANQIEQHLRGTLPETLSSWIEMQGPAFRYELPLLLYYLWEKDLHTSEIHYAGPEPPLLEGAEYKRLYDYAEWIYFSVLVTRFRITLEHFDPSRFLTMYDVDAMTGAQFEEFLETMLAGIGFEVQLGKRTADQGADLFAEKLGRRMVIQAKNYSDTIGNSAVQQVLAAKAFYGCDDSMVITNSFFTSSAKELAQSAGVKLVDRQGLQQYLDDFNQMIVQAAAPAQAAHHRSPVHPAPPS